MRQQAPPVGVSSVGCPRVGVFNLPVPFVEYRNMFPGPMQLVLVVLIVLLLFGGAKVPDLMRNLGRGASEFKKGLADEDKGDDRHLDDKRS